MWRKSQEIHEKKYGGQKPGGTETHKMCMMRQQKEFRIASGAGGKRWYNELKLATQKRQFGKKYGAFSSGLTNLKVCIQNSDIHMHHRVNTGVRDKHWGAISIQMVFGKVKIERHRCRLIKEEKVTDLSLLHSKVRKLHEKIFLR